MITIKSDPTYGGWQVVCDQHGLIVNGLVDDGDGERRALGHKSRSRCDEQIRTISPDEYPAVETEGRTPAELRLEGAIFGASILLRDREYAKLEALLSKLALDARSLALLGPEGADGIPVSHVDVAAAEALGIPARGTGPFPSTPPPGGGYDAPAGAGDSVEADRG